MPARRQMAKFSDRLSANAAHNTFDPEVPLGETRTIAPKLTAAGAPRPVVRGSVIHLRPALLRAGGETLTAF